LLNLNTRRTRRDRFLGQIEVVTPWDELFAVLRPYYPNEGVRGRPPIGMEGMLRMYIGQQCFGLSDEVTEDALYDSHAVRHFVGLDLGRESAADVMTLLKFRRMLVTRQLSKTIFE
jgi:IS5 family transposase